MGKLIKGNPETTSKGGRILVKMLNKHNLMLLTTIDNCDGTWTRIENEGYGRYHDMIQEMKISSIIEKRHLQESYNQWTKKVEGCTNKEEKMGRVKRLQKIKRKGYERSCKH